jgi:murein DD-endopeptidase MepM/ murein hydrolase activator NlpD
VSATDAVRRLVTPRRVVAGAVAAITLLSLSPAIGAQDDPTTTSTEPTVTSPSSSTTSTTVPDGSSTTTTLPTTTDPGTGTTVPLSPTIPPAIDPSIPIPPNVDLGQDEDDVDTTPDSPAGPWDGVGITNPLLAGLSAQLDMSQNKLAAAQLAVTQAEAALTTAQADRATAEGAHKEAADRYAAIRARFSQRVAASYIAAGDPGLRLRPQRDISNEADRVVLPGAVTKSDQALAADYQSRRDALSASLRTAIESETTATATLDGAKAALAAAQAAASAAELAISQTPGTIPGFVFPVAGPTSFIDSFGFCRDGCTRKHQGNDLFARAGTPVVAVEDGWVEKVGTNRLGGLTVWVRGKSGYRYYYAHLRDWAPLVVEQTITAGTVVGTVGSTGNAAGGPSHLHFEIHPGKAAAIDPYQILAHAPRVQLTPEQIAQASGITPEQAAALQALPAPPNA